MPRLVWRPIARADIKKIYVDIAKENPQSAERYFEKIRAKAERLRIHPRLGERHPEIFLTARMLVAAPFVILYETVPDNDDVNVEIVEIVRVVDGRRDVKSLFE